MHAVAERDLHGTVLQFALRPVADHRRVPENDHLCWTEADGDPAPFQLVDPHLGEIVEYRPFDADTGPARFRDEMAKDIEDDQIEAIMVLGLPSVLVLLAGWRHLGLAHAATGRVTNTA